ncbi:S9 family peptidase [bacterium]|nr:S9 family peptidase [bacterium]
MKRLLALLALSQLAHAQDPFLKEYCETRGYLLGRPVKARYTHGGRLLYLQSGAQTRSQSLYEWGPQGPRLVLSPDQNEKLSPEEKARNERKRQIGTGFTEFLPSPTDEKVLLPLAGRLILIEQNNQTRTLPVQNAIDPKWSPDGLKIAYVKAQDIYLFNLKTNSEEQVTHGGSLEITHGLAEFVAQEEMRRHSGYCWSPDSRQIAYEVADHRGVEIWYISDPLHPENAPARQYYPRPFKANVKVSLEIVELRSGKIRQLALPAEYLASMQWTKEALTLQLQDRSQQHLKLVKVDQQLVTLQEESSPAYVPLHQSIPRWVDSQHFLTLKRRDDRLALFLSDLKQGGRFLEPSQNYDIDEVVCYDRQKNAALLRIDSAPGNPRLHWVSLQNESIPDPPWEGVEEAAYHKGHLATQQQSMEAPPGLLVDGQPVPSPAINPSLTLNAEFATVGDFRAILIRPHDFQKGRKYPVILDVYGGPTKIQVAHSQRAWLLDQWLADQGFLVVAADNRGTPGRGLAWQEAVYQKFDSLPLDDQILALQLLAQKHPEIDLERIGSWGWSFGGYLSAQAVLKRPDFFKCAVAGAAVTDWADYDTHYTERYLGLKPEAYERSSLITQASSLKRPLLLVHGSADDNVYFRHSLRLSDALLRHNQPYELLVLPGITHSFRPDVTITERLWSRSVQFFKQHL